MCEVGWWGVCTVMVTVSVEVVEVGMPWKGWVAAYWRVNGSSGSVEVLADMVMRCDVVWRGGGGGGQVRTLTAHAKLGAGIRPDVF